MLIGGIALLVGVGLFAFGTAGLLATFSPRTTSLPPGEFFNESVSAQPGSVLTYLVGIDNFAAGDQLAVAIQPPTGGSQQQATVNTSDPLIANFTVSQSGTHSLVIQNTGPRTVSVLYAIAPLDLNALLLAGAGVFLGFAGLIVFIVGLVIWIVGRRRRPPVTPEMPPPP